MSAASFIVRSQRSFLLADGAQYRDDGTVVGLGSKILAVPRLRMAIALTGKMGSRALARTAELLSAFRDQDAAIGQLSSVLMALDDDKRTAVRQGINADYDLIQMFVASYSRRRGRAEGFVCASQDGALGPTWPAFKLAGPFVKHHPPVLSPPVDYPVGPEHSFAPLADGRAILEAQRMVPHENGTFVVGGFGEMATVDKEGVRVRRILEWPDRVGEKIALSA